MELANCFSIPILPPFVHFCNPSARGGDDREVQGDDGTVAARST